MVLKKLKTSENVEEFVKEAMVWKSLNHPKIVQVCKIAPSLWDYVNKQNETSIQISFLKERNEEHWCE